MVERLQRLIATGVNDPKSLRLLQQDPQALGSTIDLGDDVLEAFRSADGLFRGLKNPLVHGGTITLHTITITGTKEGIESPTCLADLTKESLISLVERILTDSGYASQVREFLNLEGEEGACG